MVMVLPVNIKSQLKGRSGDYGVSDCCLKLEKVDVCLEVANKTAFELRAPWHLSISLGTVSAMALGIYLFVCLCLLAV